MKTHEETVMNRDLSNERGIALIIVMFMVLTMSLVGASLMFVSRTETLSSLNYQTVSQTRYAAESGINSATNYIIHTYVAPTLGGADDLANYDMTKSPVQWNNAAVVLSSDPAVPSNYPLVAVQNAFSAASQGNLTAGSGSTAYIASATLMSMSTFTDAFTGAPVTLQTWSISGTGSIAGAGSASVQVTATLEHNNKPAYQYAAFATDNGCDALKFGGGAHTGNYNSAVANDWQSAGADAAHQIAGNVGTNGNLDELGNSTTIYGSLSTPRTGVGNCSANNVTALSSTGGATVTGGITQLSQPLSYPDPPVINPVPPTSDNGFNKNSNAADCNGIAGCSLSGTNDGITIHPATAQTHTQLGNVKVSQNGSVLHLGAGIYEVNSFQIGSGAQIVVDSGPVIIKVAGNNLSNNQAAIDLASNSISNTTYNPQNLQFQYGGTGTVNISGGAGASAVVYAPHATASFQGGGTIYGAVITAKVTDMGGASVFFDTNLYNSGKTDGNPVMDQFTWKNY
jgi:hypothetical protein